MGYPLGSPWKIHYKWRFIAGKIIYRWVIFHGYVSHNQRVTPGPTRWCLFVREILCEVLVNMSPISPFCLWYLLYFREQKNCSDWVFAYQPFLSSLKKPPPCRLNRHQQPNRSQCSVALGLRPSPLIARNTAGTQNFKEAMMNVTQRTWQRKGRQVADRGTMIFRE